MDGAVLLSLVGAVGAIVGNAVTLLAQRVTREAEATKAHKDGDAAVVAATVPFVEVLIERVQFLEKQVWELQSEVTRLTTVVVGAGLDPKPRNG